MDIANKSGIKRCFSRAAKIYDQHAFLQHKVANQLLEYFLTHTPRPTHFPILDLGCGTGYILPKLRKIFPHANILGVDLSEAQSLEASRKHPSILCGDFDALPFPNHTFEVIFSSLSLQWSSHLLTSLQEISRVLKPGGRLIFSTLGDGSLIELSQAKKRSNPELLESIISPRFLPAAETARHLTETNFEILSEKRLSETFRFDHPLDVIRSLKSVGASHLDSGILTLSTKKTFERLCESYEQDSNGQYPLTYQVDYFMAVKDE